MLEVRTRNAVWFLLGGGLVLVACLVLVLVPAITPWATLEPRSAMALVTLLCALMAAGVLLALFSLQDRS